MFCKNCGTKITEGSNFCSNCGASLGTAYRDGRNEKPFWRYGWFTVLMLFVCFPVGLILVFMNHGKFVKFIAGAFLAMILWTALSTTGGYPTLNDVKSFVGMEVTDDKSMVNATQIEFSKRLKEFKSAYNKAGTELQKSEVVNQQAKYLKDFFNKNEVQGWTGEVFLIEAVEGGRFASVHLKCRVDGMSYDITTERYASILSDNETLVANDSDLYQKLKTLKNYDDVVFSARVIKDKNRFYNGDRILGAVDVWSPEIVVQFTDIKKVDNY